MKKEVLATVTAAIDAYMQMEEAQRAMIGAVVALPFSPWKLFGLQEQMRVRSSAQQKSRRR